MFKIVQNGNNICQKLNRIKSIIKPPVKIVPVGDLVEIFRDVKIPMRDGVCLSANVYTPKLPGKYPVLLSLHPYQKDSLPDKKIPFQYRVIRQSGNITFSSETGWEAPDPKTWTEKGYVVINIDKRGFGKSDGEQEFFVDEEGRDYYDAIEWAAVQNWSSGKVGLFGVSYLAVSQYKAAMLNPPHLCAICPWEGFSDVYKDIFRPGGIQENGFILLWTKGVIKNFGLDFRTEQIKHKLRDEFYKSMIPDLSKINVPALICGSFSDQYLHTGGSFRAFEQISSKHKWLYTHRTGKWASFYSKDAFEIQLKFFDYFLKGIENGIMEVPPVRLEIRETREKINQVRGESTWPLKDTKWKPLYLNCDNNKLTTNTDTKSTSVSFDINNESMQFNYEFSKDTEIVGPMKITLFIKLTNTKDMNLFVGVQKFSNQNQVCFEGSYGFANDVVTKGFMTISLRKLNEKLSKHYLPEHDFDQVEELAPDEIAKLEIGLLPSATLFRKGEVLRLVIQGKALLKYGKLDQVGAHEPSTNGQCTILSDDEHQSVLLVPFIEN